jgi:hypothetical protein
MEQKTWTTLSIIYAQQAFLQAGQIHSTQLTQARTQFLLVPVHHLRGPMAAIMVLIDRGSIFPTTERGSIARDGAVR